MQISVLLEKRSLDALLLSGTNILFKITRGDLHPTSSPPLPDAVGIQRLLTLASISDSLEFEWEEEAAKVVFASPSLFPLLAVVLCLQDVSHATISSTGSVKVCETEVNAARRHLLRQRLQIDAFADRQIALCADSLGHGVHPDLYSKNGTLLSSDEMGGMLEDFLFSHLAIGVDRSLVYKQREILGVILSELFENTEIHGKGNLTGTPIIKNGLRGLIIKRIELEAPTKGKEPHPMVPYLELSVFDSGIGFYASFEGRLLDSSISLGDEWEVLRHCLERHAAPARSDRRPEYRGLGLYEVLRTLMFAKGYMEVRTGRLYAYRTFREGDLIVQLESEESPTRPGKPKPVLLDVERSHFQVPTEHENLVGSSVRVLIPLK